MREHKANRTVAEWPHAKVAKAAKDLHKFADHKILSALRPLRPLREAALSTRIFQTETLGLSPPKRK